MKPFSKLLLLSISVVALTWLYSCEKETHVNVQSVTLDKTELSMVIGDKQSIVPTILPDRASNKGVTWESSNPEIASIKGIGNKGEVTSIKEGEAVITVITLDGNKTATCKVVVSPMIINIERITIIESELLIGMGDKTKLEVIISPTNATNKNIIWTSDNIDIATVNEEGVVEGISIGETIITARSEDGGKKASCKVTVSGKDEVSEVKLNIEEIQLLPNDTRQLTATVLPESTSNKNVIWTTDNERVATVSNSGLVTAISLGEAKITATTEVGEKTATCKVNVVNEIIAINLLNTEYEDYSFERTTTNKSWPPFGGTWGGSDIAGIGKFGSNSTAIRVIPESAPEPRVPRTGVSYLFLRMRDNETTESLDWLWRKISNLTPGASYTFSFWYKTPPGSALNQTGEIKLGAVIEEIDVATLANALSPVVSFGYIEPSSEGAGDGSADVHKEVRYTFTMPSGQTEVYISWIRNGNQQPYIDDMSLVRNN